MQEIIAIYARKSRFTGKGESIGNQVDECKEYLKTTIYSGHEVRVYEDEGKTGANLNRPKFQEMMADVRRNKIKMIVCYRLDRLSRSVSDFTNLYNELQSLNVGFCSVRDKFDTTTPMGKAMMYISSVFAQLERDVITERIKDNMANLAKTGRWLGGNTPLGYKSKKVEKIDIEGKKRSLFMLEAIDEEKDIVVLIFSKYRECKSLTGVVTYLINNHIKTKRNKNFTRFAVKMILENPVYAIADKDMYEYFSNFEGCLFAEEKDFDGISGTIGYSKTIQVKGKRMRKRAVEDWIVAVGKHIGFISGKEWVEVQELLGMNEEKRYRRPRKNESILSGLVKCGECGSFMRPKVTGRIDKEGRTKFSYLCELKTNSSSGECQAKNVLGFELDEAVLREVKKVFASNEEIGRKLRELATSSNDESIELHSKIKVLQNTYSQNQQSIESLVNKLKFIDNDVIDEVTKEIKALKEANMRLEKEIKEVSKNNANVIEKETAELVLDILNRYMDDFDNLDIMKKREFMRIIIKDIVVKGNDVVINFLQTDEKFLFPKGKDCK